MAQTPALNPTNPPAPNHLAGETSPYLLQHLYNPVDWHPWNEATLAKAAETGTLLLVSIGYSACHWCHVMEHESFEDPDVAAVMNTRYLPIKVDREERPDVDDIYMEAVQAITGRGGWPLNVVCLPDGRPVWGGTYFPKNQWLYYLNEVADAHARDPKKFAEQADRLVEYLNTNAKVPAGPGAASVSRGDVLKTYNQFEGDFDLDQGGFKRVPKFPLPVGWRYVLRQAHFTALPTADAALEATLNRMAWGGLYDPIGGGFARYSVDGEWHVPHFEKMLYDNGQLVSLYAEAFRSTRNPAYAQVVRETLAWVEREMTSPEGGFYSALDADSEGEEGKFYVWSAEAFDQAVGDDAALLRAYYDVRPNGNWEHTNVLIRRQSDAAFAEQHGISVSELQAKVAQANAALFAARTPRVRPGLDDKVLTAWNGLMTRGYVEAYRALREPTFLAAAERNTAFIQANVAEGPRLHRNFKNGTATINGYLDDYAFTIDALLALYQVTFQPSYLEQAETHTAYVLEHFGDGDHPLLFYTSDLDPPLVARRKELYDNVIPSSNAQMAHNLKTLGHLTGKPAYTTRAAAMLGAVQAFLEKYATSFALWAELQLRFLYPDHELAVVGENALKIRAELDAHAFLPNVVFLGATDGTSALALLQGKYKPGETVIYVCRDRVCQRPTAEVAEALRQLREDGN